eukprot:GHRQ01024174.1.p1 GENE.GHRQ01024174.1~~GHRQ01024174.1.p1  ORF type:complete len:228 (+),score=52.51 GHRQ01024174.1:210-893(+)
MANKQGRMGQGGHPHSPRQRLNPSMLNQHATASLQCHHKLLLSSAGPSCRTPYIMCMHMYSAIRIDDSVSSLHRLPQGATDAHEFFVLEIGACDVFVTRPGDLTAKKVKTYGPGSAFGELALLYSAPRAATVTTTSPCKVWIAERRVVGTIKRHFAEKNAAVKVDLLEKVPMFGVITDAHKQLLAGALEQVCVCVAASSACLPADCTTTVRYLQHRRGPAQAVCGQR